MENEIKGGGKKGNLLTRSLSRSAISVTANAETYDWSSIIKGFLLICWVRFKGNEVEIRSRQVMEI